MQLNDEEIKELANDVLNVGFLLNFFNNFKKVRDFAELYSTITICPSLYLEKESRRQVTE
jgi:hypothetical protein